MHVLDKNTSRSFVSTCITVYVLRAGMDTRLAEDYAQHESQQHLSNSLSEKAVSSVVVVTLHCL